MEIINYIMNNFHIDDFHLLFNFFAVILIVSFFYILSLFIDRNQVDGKYQRAWIRAGLAAYVFLILAVTLLERTSTGIHRANWIPLWTWIEIFNGVRPIWNLEEICLNILLFIPLGCLISLGWKTSKIKALLIGLTLSAAIETTQYFLCLGLFEWDDMIYNSLGCMIGVVVVNAIKKLKNKSWLSNSHTDAKFRDGEK